MPLDSLVVLRGGGDLGTGVAHRLVRAGYRVVVLETSAPRAVRRRVAFAEAVLSGETTVEGVTARRVPAAEAASAWAGGRGGGDAGARAPWVPVVVDPSGDCIDDLAPDVIVDARMAMSRAFRECPCFVSSYPSMEVVTAAAAPGVFMRIAVIDPP